MPHLEFDGSQYEKASAHQTQWGQELISFLSLSGTESILDLGCGDGRLTKQLAQLVPHGSVLGIDASAGMIQTAQQREENNLSFQQMDINAIDFREEFDVIFSNAALHWILDHRRLLRAAYCAQAKWKIALEFCRRWKLLSLFCCSATVNGSTPLSVLFCIIRLALVYAHIGRISCLSRTGRVFRNSGKRSECRPVFSRSGFLDPLD